MNKQLKTIQDAVERHDNQNILKSIEVPLYNGYSKNTIHIAVANYGYCHLKIGDDFMVYANRMYDLHIDQFEEEGPKSIQKFILDTDEMIIARTPDGIEAIIFLESSQKDEQNDEQNTDYYSNEELYISIMDKGTLLITNLEIGIYTNLQNRENLWQ